MKLRTPNHQVSRGLRYYNLFTGRYVQRNEPSQKRFAPVKLFAVHNEFVLRQKAHERLLTPPQLSESVSC